MAPGMSIGLAGGSKVEESARCSGVRGTEWLPGTMNRHLSRYRALHGVVSNLALVSSGVSISRIPLNLSRPMVRRREDQTDECLPLYAICQEPPLLLLQRQSL
jgi:hypothetical protein